MSEADYEALRADVEAQGKFTDDGILFEGKILDGRHRYRISRDTGIKLCFKSFRGTRDDAVKYVKSRAHGRTMTESQKACAAVKFLPYFKALAEKRMRAGGPEPVPEGGKGDARDQAGGMFGVSGRYVSDAKLLFERAPKLFQQCFDDKDFPITKAKRQMQRRDRRRSLDKLAKSAPPVGDCEIVAVDCLKGLEGMRAKSVKLIAVDPPYNIGIDYGLGAKRDSLKPESYIAWCRAWIEECKRVLTDDGSIFIINAAQWLAPLELSLLGFGFHRRNVIVWHETFGQHTNANFTDCWRPIIYYTKSADDFTWNGDEIVIPSDRQTKYADARANEAGKVPTNVWQVPRIADNHPERVPGYPTQIPEAIVERIVKVASNPGDLVCDLFVGSGTTPAVACRNGRKFIGFESNKKYAAGARLRVRAACAKRKGR